MYQGRVLVMSEPHWFDFPDFRAFVAGHPSSSYTGGEPGEEVCVYLSVDPGFSGEGCSQGVMTDDLWEVVVDRCRQAFGEIAANAQDMGVVIVKITNEA